MTNIFQSQWSNSYIPNELIESIVNQCETSEMTEGSVGIKGEEILNTKIRDSKVSFLPDTHWIAGVMRHYVERFNEENFKYDLHSGFDNHTIQYGTYHSGGHYVWHKDADIWALPNEDFTIRKLSVTVQLSEPDDYEGGELQLQGPNGELYSAPKDRGTVIVFDSRTMHRVRPVKSGVRKSLVGWVSGPRWR